MPRKMAGSAIITTLPLSPAMKTPSVVLESAIQR